LWNNLLKRGSVFYSDELQLVNCNLPKNYMKHTSLGYHKLIVLFSNIFNTLIVVMERRKHTLGHNLHTRVPNYFVLLPEFAPGVSTKADCMGKGIISF
jgi:hypothetical protein